MGCDIHVHVEYKRKGTDNWWYFGKGLNPGRDYGMFSTLANVRTRGESGYSLEPKGLPENLSSPIQRENSLYITDDSPDEEGCCSKSNAERWVNNGSSKYLDVSKNRITHPDWHSHSWLSLSEYSMCLNKWGSVAKYVIGSPYYVLESMLKTFEQKGCESRLVFWFDN